MGKLSEGRILRALNTLNTASLTNIMAETMRLLLSRGAKLTWNVPDQSQAMLNDYNKVVMDTYQLNGVASTIIGIALAGFGNVPKEQIKELASQMFKYSGDVIQEMERFDQKWDAHTQLIGPPVMEMFNACKSYYSGLDPKGDQLRAIMVDDNPLYSPLTEIREKFTPGPEADETKAWLAREVFTIWKPDGINKVCTQDEAIDSLYERLFSQKDQIKGDELAAFEQMEAWALSDNGMHDNLKQHIKKLPK